MKIEISICTGLMLNDHSNPYIESDNYVVRSYFLRTCRIIIKNPVARWLL